MEDVEVMELNDLEEMMRKLTIKERRASTLYNLELKIDTVNKDLYEVMLRAENMLEFLAAANSDQLSAAMRIIFHKGVASFPQGSSTIDQFIERCLNHPSDTVKEFGLRGAHTLWDASLPVATNNIHLILKNCLPMATGVSGTVIQMLAKLLPPLFADPQVQAGLQAALECSDTIRCRVYDIVCQILQQHPEHFPTAEPILQRALSDLDTNDVLLQTNVLEILSPLVATMDGFAYIEKVDLFNKLKTILNSVARTPFIRFILPDALRFYGNAASLQPAMFFSRYPEAIDFIFEQGYTEDDTCSLIAYESIAVVAAKDVGKIYLHTKLKDKMDKLLGAVKKLIHSSRERYGPRFIDSLTNIIAAENADSTVNNQIAVIARDFYEAAAGRSDLQMVMELFVIPFSEVKMASLKLLSAIIDYRWGQLYLKDTACFIEGLLNRSLDSDAQVTRYKYEVIKKLATSTVLDRFDSMALQQYVSDGAFYKKATVEVDFEGGQ
ncbi:hypothetical protein AND_004298 [Anopheles darlingi]|uniref:26S proteasome non-ATPase regulatory subunit 5 n=1 Tax=Anopheles darlingi TaxID=43151 RepID=W5JKZ2_ANODA|nr:hypothetical protein AND_004298 [Anopheles darlingi]